MQKVAFLILGLMMPVLFAACASRAALEDPRFNPTPQPQAIQQPAAARPPAPARGNATQGSLGRLGLNAPPPQGMCWPEINGRDASLYNSISASITTPTLQPLALALPCGQLEAWRVSPSALPSSYVLITQKMDERVGGGGESQAKDRWLMVQTMGGTFGFYPQEQYRRMDYLNAQAAKLAPGQLIKLGEIRRDDMALYTVGLQRPPNGEVQFVLDQYSQIRGTPIVISWYQPLAGVTSISRQILDASSWLALLIRQSDAAPGSGSAAPAPAAMHPASPAPLPPAPPHPSQIDAGQRVAENLVASRLTTTAPKDITGWENAGFGFTLAQLSQIYPLSEASREEVRGQAYYLRDKFAAIGGMTFKVLFDFSDSPLGEGKLGRIIFSNTTSGGNMAFQKSSLLNAVNSWYGPPSKDDSRAGNQILWKRPSGQASLQMISSDDGNVWLLVLEATAL